MGYDIIIGEAIECYDVTYDKEWMTVGEVIHPYAPAFGEITDYSNVRHPSYSVWYDFLREVALFSLFLDNVIGLMRPHPGLKYITKKHQQKIDQAYVNYVKKYPHVRPGFVDAGELSLPVEYDSMQGRSLARLTWLKFWVDWAMENCEYPAIYNS